MNLALFDFDGTVTSCDSFLLFIRYAVGEQRFLLGGLALSPKITLYKLGKYPNDRLKEDFLKHFFKGWEERRFNEAAQNFAADTIPGILRPRAIQRLQTHQQRGDTVVLVSASPENILSPWCGKMGIDLLATRLEVRKGRLTGMIRGRNCWGEEKVERIQKSYSVTDFAETYAYGDSRGDRPMLAMADKPYYRHF